MRTLPILAAGAAAMLLAGCTGHQPARHHDAAEQPSGTVATSVTPAGSATPPPSTPAPATATVPAPVTVPARASSSAPAPNTRQVVLRPVTGRGTVAPGYALARHLAEQVDCASGGGFPSPVAVDKNILECGPAASYPAACWPSATPDTALCYRNPFANRVEMLTAGPVPAVPATTRPAPYGLVLRDGGKCTVRIGGAWGQPVGHPELYGTYSCSNGEDVWATLNSDGVNRTGAFWTVLVGSADDRGPLHTETVLAAYFVGTAATP